jgi:DNA-binding XRE family transcriptional regulator
LVQELYIFDEDFIGVDSRTITRWEHAYTQPSLKRQINIVKYFQTKSNKILPCFDTVDKIHIENEICKLGIKNLIGSSKEHILNFPTKSFKVNDIVISHIRSAKNIDKTLEMPYDVIKNLTDNTYNLSFKMIKKWALHPSNLFLLSEYKNQFAGILFIIRLKPDIFNKIIDFDIEVKDICLNDFAGFDEMGCNMPIVFFAFNDKSSTLLMLRFYAHLIANQDVIQSVGATPILEGARKILKKMNMHYYKNKKIKQGTLTSYQAPLYDVLINEAVIKMIFQKQKCPQDNN